MVDSVQAGQRCSRSSRLVHIASIFVFFSIIPAIFFLIIDYKAVVWVSVYAFYLVFSVLTLLMLVKRHPLGRSLAVWAPWIALALSMLFFHRALYLVSHYPHAGHPGIQETMAFILGVVYAIIMLPASILLSRPAAKASFFQVDRQLLTLAPGRLPWPVWAAAALYCLPFLFAFFTLLGEIAARESTGTHGPFVDLVSFGLLMVAISLIRRSRIARTFAHWLPLCCLLIAFFVGRGIEYTHVGGITFVATYEAEMVRRFLGFSAFTLAPAIIFLNLSTAKGAFMPVNATPSLSPTDTIVDSAPETSPSPGSDAAE